jgi:tripartite-type tricarboxylate transporter receptor subunit TctC
MAKSSTETDKQNSMLKGRPIMDMKNSRHRQFRAIGVAAAGFAITLASAAVSFAQESAQDFYTQTKSITIAGGHDAGSGFDFYMRTVAAAIPRVSDLKAEVRNIPGGGGLIGDNQVFEGTADGSQIGLLNFPGHVFAQLTGAEGVRFDFSKWEYLGRIAAGPPVVLVAAEGPYKSAADLIAASSEVRFAIEEAGSDAYYGAAVTADTFGFPARSITGYEGTSDILAAIMRGEADATFLSYGSALEGINSGEMRALMIFSDARVEALPDVPLASEVAQDQGAKDTLIAFGNIYNLERVFVAPPGTPADRVEYLRDLLVRAFADETLASEIAARGRPLNPMPGADVSAAVEAVAGQADKIRELLQ